MPQRSVASNYTFEQQRTEINLLAADFWSHYNVVETAKSTYLKHNGSNDFTGATLNVPNAFTINSNSGGGTVTIAGNLDVTGTTTTVSSANLEVTDKNILIAKGSTSDAQADGAGITIDSATDITWNFVDADDAWVSSIGVKAIGGFTGNLTGSATKVNITDHTNTSEENHIVFIEDAQGAGSRGLESDSTLTYNPSTGKLTATQLGGTLQTAAQANITSVGTLTSLSISGNLDVDGTTDLDVTNVDGVLTMMGGWNLAFQNGFNNKTSAIVNSGASGKSNLEFKVDDGNGLVKRLSVLNTGTVRVNKGSGIGMALVPANNTDTFQLQFDLADTTNKGYVNYDFNTDKMKFRAGGSGDQLVITNGGLGIGTDSPGQLLEINGASSPCVLVKDTTNNVISYLFADDSNAFVGSASNHPVIIQQNNGAAITIDTSKNVTLAGTLDIPAVAGTNTNADLAVLFQTSAGVIEGGSGLTYNPGGDTLKVNGLTISQGGINGNAASLNLSCANHSSTCSINVGSVITTKANILPDADNADDLGSTTKRFANVYTGDMHLNNMNSGGNEVDGSEGHWTMQEGSDDLFLINRNTGKKYKFNLTEVS